MNQKIAPSLMGMDLMNVERQIKELNQYAYQYHIDYIDWHYAKNMCLSPQFVGQLRKITDRPIDVHIMVSDLDIDIIKETVNAGADILSLPVEEIEKNVFSYIDYIKSAGKKFGVVLNPATSLDKIQGYIDQVDEITFMGVTPGFAGQKLVPGVLEKIGQAHEIREKYGYRYLTQIDGGCHQEMLGRIMKTNVDIIIVGGTCLFSQNPDMNIAWKKMEEIFKQAIE